jgi:signal transduction histidine kinase
VAMSKLNRQSDEILRREIEQLRQTIATLEALQFTTAKAAAEDCRGVDRLLELYEHERQLVGYEIHDGFVQDAPAALLQLQAFEEQLKGDVDKAWKAFHLAESLLRQGIAEARRLISGLRVLVPDEHGLRIAVERLVSQLPTTGGPPTELCWGLRRAELSPRLAHTVFRIVQECLTNVARHSRSAKAQVMLGEGDNKLTVEVKDWGVGLDPQNTAQESVGLEGIRLRARLAGGSARIDSAPGRGTTIIVELPLEPANAHDC